MQAQQRLCGVYPPSESLRRKMALELEEWLQVVQGSLLGFL